MAYFYADASNQPLGPVSLEELKDLRQAGQIGEHTPVIEEGAAEWRVCRDFIPLAVAPWSPPAPPPAHVFSPSSVPVSSCTRLAIVALAFAVLGFIGGAERWTVGVVFAVAAVVCGHLARRARKSDGGARTALAALIIGYLAVLTCLGRVITPVPPRPEPLTAATKVSIPTSPGTLMSGSAPPSDSPSTNVSPATTANPEFANSWNLVLHKGRNVPYEIIVPSYWQEMKQPFDANADREFVGPQGLVFSIYSLNGKDSDTFWLNSSDSDTFWDSLRKFAKVSKFTYEPGDNDPDVLSSVVVTAEPVAGLQLRNVWIVKLHKKTLAGTLWTPADFPNSGLAATRALDAAIWEMGFILGYTRSSERNVDNKSNREKQQNREKQNKDSESPLLRELAKASRAGEMIKSGASGTKAYTKEDWKGTLRWYFHWSPGGLFNGKSLRFQQVMGEPDRTQTIYGQTYWYYECSDGPIQLVMSARDLKTGLLQAEIKDSFPDELAKGEAAETTTPPVTNGVNALSLTKAQWKEKMARNFRWFPGTPVMGQARNFQQVMGQPDRTQTVGQKAYWYYECSDGTIQLVMDVLNLQTAGYLQADVNDY